MAKYPNKSKIATAITKHSVQDLSCTHVTTGNFMDFQVSKYLELVPKQKVEINHNVFARMDALNVPTYGDASIHNRAFFVPYRTIFPAWNDFITDAVHTYSDNVSNLVGSVPLLSNIVLAEVFTDYTDMATSAPSNSFPNVDINIITSNNEYASGLNLTAKGARFLKLLYSLGYRIDFNLANPNQYYSALPFFAAVKVFYDWYYPGAYVQDEQATKVINWLKYDQGATNKEFHNVFTTSDLHDMITFMDKVNYDSDYFTSSWDNPNAPNASAYSSVILPDVTAQSNVYSSRVQSNDSGNGTPIIRKADGTSNVGESISQYILTGLRSLTDYMKRHQLAGARALDRYLSRFGVTLSAEKLNRSIYISDFRNNQPVQFGDVTSQSDTSAIGGMPLGSYAGKGISFGDGSSFTFETDEYGMLIIVSTIVPRVCYTQGQDRVTMHTTRYDFYTPEFDNMGVQAVATKELFVPLHADEEFKPNSNPSLLPVPTPFNYGELVFGFVPRYAEYKRGIDHITGDFILGSRNTLLHPWNMNRDITPMARANGVRNLKHSRNFLLGDDSTQYNRIFNYLDDSKLDHFKILHQFKIKSYFPGSSLFDSYEFENEDKADKVNVDVNGVKDN